MKIRILIISLISIFLLENLFSQISYHHKSAQNPFLTQEKSANTKDSYDVLKYRLEVEISPAGNSITASNYIWIKAIDDLNDAQAQVHDKACSDETPRRRL